jgi:hypothetical protein
MESGRKLSTALIDRPACRRAHPGALLSFDIADFQAIETAPRIAMFQELNDRRGRRAFGRTPVRQNACIVQF